MTLDDMFDLIEAHQPKDDYVVRLKLKYNHEKEYRYTTEILTFDGSYGAGCFVWENDWDEGEQDVEVIGFMSLEVLTPIISDKFCV